MKDELFQKFRSNTPVGSGNNKFVELPAGTYTFRMIIPPKFHGTHQWRFWYSNIVDSTWNMGEISRSGLCGSQWNILSASVGVCPRNFLTGYTMSTLLPVTYDGQASKTVAPAEQFWSDPVEITVPEGEYLVFSWCISFASHAIVPCTPDSQTMCVVANGDASMQPSSEQFMIAGDTVMPNLFGADIDAKKTMIFMGDSITQGIGSDKYMHNHWVAQISDKISKDIAVWDIGLGFARAQDAGRNNNWLGKAMKGDIVCLCLGVNDLMQGISADEISESLTNALFFLAKNNPDCRLILLTTPPFDYQGEILDRWRKIMNQELHVFPTYLKIDGVFDTSSVWGLDAPEQHRSRYGGHPNAIGSTAMANAFCRWYAEHFND